jgi:hypothetical protein
MTMITTTTTISAANSAPGSGNGASGHLTTRELEESTGTLPVLGYSVQWNLCHVEIAHTDLVNALRAAGFSTPDPPQPSPTVALRRAMVKWVQNRAMMAAPLSYPYRPTEPGILAVGIYDSTGEGEYGEDDEDEPAVSNGKGRGKAKAHKSLLRKINSPQSDWLVFGLVIEQLDLAELGLSYVTRLRVFLHKKTLAIRVSQAEAGLEPDNLTQPGTQDDEQQEADDNLGDNRLEPGLATITGEIQQLFHYYREHHQARDISSLLKQLVGGLDSFSLRRLGGVYFVPEQHRAALDSLRKLVEDLPAVPGQISDTFMLKLPILDGAGARKQLAQAAYRDFIQELAALQSDLDRLADEAAHHPVRHETIARRLTTYRELKAKAEVYAELLDMQQGRILSAVEQLTGQAAALLDNLSDSTQEAAGHQQAFDWENLNPAPSGIENREQFEVRVTSI